MLNVGDYDGQRITIRVAKQTVWYGAEGLQELLFMASESGYKVGSLPKLYC
ncbi:hypothetical protein AM10699_63380 (plasmid) [Acaryochloris marina MBIC10699]|nr:hypothetical protein AM10699_63380 [Acaryochloris marina MBIC10699]